ncbi:MAG: hypothetical protein LAQ69_35735 [Acidobacteriia bacterium]|nr:hypothetical protein [Terriglobia bacterium]
MRIPVRVKSDLAYARNLVEAGMQGVTSVRREAARQTPAPGLGRADRNAWVSAAIGAAVGIGGACLTRNRKSGYNMLLGGVLGGSLGYTGAVAWGSRDVTAAIAGRAIRNVNAVRDARWLEKNPIAYA